MSELQNENTESTVPGNPPRQPKQHELKCWPESFVPIFSGRKSFDVRVNDRDFHEGDVLLLREWIPPHLCAPGELPHYTGNEIYKHVTYLMEIDTDKKLVCMGLAHTVNTEIGKLSINEGFADDLKGIINKHSMENGSNTPDFILTVFLNIVLKAADYLINQREQWYGRCQTFAKDAPAKPEDFDVSAPKEPYTPPFTKDDLPPKTPSDHCVIQATSNGGGWACWLVEVVDVPHAEAEGPIIRMINTRDKATRFTLAQAEGLLPKVRTTHPDAKIVI